MEKEHSSREGTNTWLGQWRDVWNSWSRPTKGECDQDFSGSLVVKNLPANMGAGAGAGAGTSPTCGGAGPLPAAREGSARPLGARAPAGSGRQLMETFPGGAPGEQAERAGVPRRRGRQPSPHRRDVGERARGSHPAPINAFPRGRRALADFSPPPGRRGRPGRAGRWGRDEGRPRTAAGWGAGAPRLERTLRPEQEGLDWAKRSRRPQGPRGPSEGPPRARLASWGLRSRSGTGPQGFPLPPSPSLASPHSPALSWP